MAVETLHRERDFLFKLLRLSKELRQNKEIKEIIAGLMASMETNDIECVKKQVMELEAGEAEENKQGK